MKLSDIGEFGLIERLAAIVGPAKHDDVIVGIGDDAAVWRSGDEYLIATTDTMVEGVHFLAGAPWEDIGWKAMAVNVSDIAAMGGWPRYALVTLCLPPDTDIQAIEQLYDGLNTYARMCAIRVIGGDTVRANNVTITVTVIGRAEQLEGEPLLLRRDAAKPGDVIAVSGMLGDSAAGLRRLREGAPPSDELASRHLRPTARLAEGVVAVQTGLRCGIDVSDGLLQDIGHICKRSNIGAVLNAADIPISDELRLAYPGDALRLACTGGEDYELVLIGAADLIQATEDELGEGALTIIGEIVKDYDRRVRVIDDAGKEMRFERPGWDAFR
ncbi:MAG: thiamine-phosphate kinase [Chloroflexota bacterium]